MARARAPPLEGGNPPRLPNRTDQRGGARRLSTDQIDHFDTFGFVVLRDFLAEHTDRLRDEALSRLR